MKLLAVAVALVALAFPAGSVAAPDERVRPPAVAPAIPPHLKAIGTDVAAPDQQSPIVPAQPESVSSGFDWSDAGIGAGSAAVVLAASLAAGLTFRRRLAG